MKPCRAFSIIESMIAMGVVGVLITALYATMAQSVRLVKLCQENERVNQLMAEKLDTVRLYNWTQVTNVNSFVPTNFIAGIDPLVTNSRPYYTGTISIVQAPLTGTEKYKTNMLQVTVQVKWVSGKRAQTRSMDTFVAKYGLQGYIMR